MGFERLHDEINVSVTVATTILLVRIGGQLTDALGIAVVDANDDDSIISLLKEGIEAFVYSPFAEGRIGIKKVLTVVHVHHRIRASARVIVGRQIHPDPSVAVELRHVEVLGKNLHIIGGIAASGTGKVFPAGNG